MHAASHEVPSGLARACRVLAAGGAVVVPNPAPMAYGLVATSARAINAAKRRPAAQNVAVSLHDGSEWRRLSPSIDLPRASLDGVVALLSRRLTVLLPLRAGVPHPAWVAPAVRDGYLAAFDGRWTATAAVWDGFPRLYGSSANITGASPAGSAAQAVAMFGAGVPVVDGDALRGFAGAGTASTMVRIDRVGRLRLHRAGAQDAAHPSGPEAYLPHLISIAALPFHLDDAE